MPPQELINMEFLKMLFHGIVAFLVLLFVIVFAYTIIKFVTGSDKDKEGDGEE